MIGRTTLESCVISKIITAPVMIAPVEAPIPAAIPAMAKATGSAPMPGKRYSMRWATRAPIVAPIKSEGEKTPPDPPEPNVRQVAMNLRPNSRNRSQGSVRTFFRMSMIVAYPTPCT